MGCQHPTWCRESRASLLGCGSGLRAGTSPALGCLQAYEGVLQLVEARGQYKELCIVMCVIPATISNNVPGTDFSLGSDTAVNAAMEVRDRAGSSSRSCPAPADHIMFWDGTLRMNQAPIPGSKGECSLCDPHFSWHRAVTASSSRPQAPSAVSSSWRQWGATVGTCPLSPALRWVPMLPMSMKIPSPSMI